MLRLMISPPGTGKTSYITEKIRETAQKCTILIVPEQSHFETERLLYKKLGARLFSSVRILSFTKLGAKIVTESKKDKAYAPDTVREITMLKSVRELHDKLMFYSQASGKPDTAARMFGADMSARMLGAVEAFQREGISPDELAEAAKEIANPRLRAKVSDLALIYERYTCSLSENFSDKPDQIRIAANLAFSGKYFAGKDVYVDGFDGFTGGQLLLLEAAMEQATSLTITLPADKSDSKEPDYAIIADLAQTLMNTAQKRNVRAVAESLPACLPPRNPCTEIFTLPDVYAESFFVAAKIRELITTANFSLNDIAVLNPPSHGALSSAFSAYGLQEFSDIPEPIIEKPLVKFILTTLEAACGQAGATSAFIKSGFMRVCEDSEKSYRPGRFHMRLLTLAAREWQLDESSWREPFPKMSDFAKADRIRAEVVRKLTDLGGRIKDTTGDKITEALSDFLINEMEIPRTIADIIYHGTKVSTALNDEYRQLWETIISVLESMHAALKGQEISPLDYTAVLGSVFGKTSIAKPPQVLDAVTVGDLRRTRTADVKVVFLMGANQGNFPSGTFTNAEFTEAEAEELGKSGIFIEENRSNRYYREKFIIHRALTLPTEKLYITAPLRDAAWKEKKPAKIITGQKEKIKNASLLPLSFWASHKDALKFRAAEKPAVSALSHALSEADPQEYSRLFGENRRHNYLHRIAPEAAELLMKKAGISPGRIETLNTCMFKYFCAEGLRIGAGRIKNGTKPDALTRGSMTHYVLENALTEYADDDYKPFLELDPQDFVKIAKKYIAEFEEAEFFGGYARSKRKKEILLMHAEGIADVLRQIREDMMMSGFRPFAFEKKFEFMLGNQLIKGKADRLDLLESADNSRYFRIIDYKTGSKKFNCYEIEYGLNLQALIYLFAITALEKDAVPSGAFYRLVNGGRLTDKAKPYGAADTDTDLYLYKNRLETQSTTGLHFGDKAREDYSDIEKINSNLKQKADAKKEFIKLENLSEDDFTALTRSVAEQLEEKLLALYGGDVRAVPFYSGTPPCLYCDYSRICGRDGKNDVKISAKKEVPE